MSEGAGERGGPGPGGDPETPLAEHVDRHCLACDSPEVTPLMVLFSDGALPGTPEHSIAYEHDVIVACGACGALRLETWWHDCFDFETWTDRHWYFPVADEEAERLRSAVDECPSPLDPGCGCAVHATLTVSLEELPPRDFAADRTQGVREELELWESWGGPCFRLRDADEEGPPPDAEGD